MSSDLEKELTLRELYYSPKTGYRSARHLYVLAKAENSSISFNFVKTWLTHQDSYTKFKKWSKPQYFRSTFVRDLGEQVQVDLVSMIPYKHENNGYQYILSAIEILSRYAFTVPIKSKSGADTLAAFKVFLSQFKDHFHTEPKLVQWDMGGEFLNKDMKKFLDTKDIVEFSTNSKRKATIVERFNRTMRNKFQKMYEHNKHKIWFDKLDELTSN